MKSKIKFALLLCLWACLFSVAKVVVIGVVVLLHEIAHICACRALGVKVFRMQALPWGLTAEAPLMHDSLSQLIVSVSGPMFNFFLLIFTPVVREVFSPGIAEVFAVANLADGILNLIPALPLDGGIILKAFFCSRFGFVRGFIFMMRFTAFWGVLLVVFGMYMFIESGSNVSYIVAGLFIVYNLKHERELVMCIRKRLLTGEISSAPSTREIKIPPESNLVCLVDFITPAHTLVFNIVNHGESLGRISQKELLDSVLKSPTITAMECYKSKVAQIK